MGDQLFLMQRYLGSDDSEVEADTKPNSKLSKLIEQAKLRKKKENQSQIPTQVNGASVSSEPSINRNSPTKKKKKCKVIQSDTSVETKNELDIQNETSEAIQDKKQKKRKYSELLNGKTQASINGNSELNSIENTSTSDINVAPKLKKKKKSNNKKSSKANHDEKSLYPIMEDVLQKTDVIVQRNLPDWLANPTIIEIDVNGKEKNVTELEFLHENIKNRLLENKINYLFPVQIAVIPWLLRTNWKRLFVRPSDICVSAPTGSGKTLAFVIPIMQSLMSRTVCQIRALIVLPVGDLAMQVFKVFKSFCKGTDLRPILVTGQKSLSQEQRLLVKRNTRGYMCLADIVVATYGRLLDHMDKTDGFSLEHLQYLVIDEADRMMEEIQQGLLKRIENAVHKNRQISGCSCFAINNAFHKTSTSSSTPCACSRVTEHLQKLFYSATMSQDPEKLHELCLYQPKLFLSSLGKEGATDNNIIGHYTTPPNLTEQYIDCDTDVKPLMIIHLLKMYKFKRILCFTESLEHAYRLYLLLKELLEDGAVCELSSNMRAVQRRIVVKRFLSGKVKVLVCSDLIARGIDIEDVDCVVCYDVPRFIKTYVHRIGRTARAGKEGIAITLLGKAEVSKFKKMLTSGGKACPSRIEISKQSLVSLEEPYKNALSKVSLAIKYERQSLSRRKKGLQRNKAEKIKSVQT